MGNPWPGNQDPNLEGAESSPMYFVELAPEFRGPGRFQLLQWQAGKTGDFGRNGFR